MSQFRKGSISRRTVLRGLGVAVGLPLLDAMRPAIALAGMGDAKASAPVRMACLFFPNGVSPKAWTPEKTGKDYELSPILKPLGAFKDDVLVLTHLTNQATDTGDGHYVKDAAWLTGTTIARTTGADLNSHGVSIDQHVARRIGNLTPLPSIELGIEPVSTGVDVAVGYTRLYGSHISWSTPTTPLAKEINPKLAFDRLFRSQAGQKKGQSDEDTSVLDLVMDDAKALRARVGGDDRAKLDEYYESVRAVEKRIAFEAADRRSQYPRRPRGPQGDRGPGRSGRRLPFRPRPLPRAEGRPHAAHPPDAGHHRPGVPDRLDARRHVHVRQRGQQQELLLPRGREGQPPRVLAP